jgi:hypothetical protein
MSAITAAPAVTVPAKAPSAIAYAVVQRAWDLYRRSQQLRSSGDLIEAQARLFRAAEPYASGRKPADEAGLPAIQEAYQRLTEVIARRGEAFMAAEGES